MLTVKDKWQDLGRQFEFFSARTPADYYAYGQWRVKQWLAPRAAHSFDVDAQELCDATDSASLTAAPTLDAARAIAAHFKTRKTPRYFFDTDQLAPLLANISSAAKQETLQEANAVLEQTFTFRGVTVHFDDRIHWQHAPQSNVDWRWDLNRHTYFVTLGRAYWYSGDESYAEKFCALLRDWLAQNPAQPQHPNWQSVFEVACRIRVWLASFYLFRHTRAFDENVMVEFLSGLLAHARYLNEHIELHVPNNHLLIEARALASVGLLFPEFKQAALWRARGETLLREQLARQVCRDGAHAERATMYHRIITHELLEWLVLLENNATPVASSLRETLNRMVDFELALEKPDGTLPLLGDSALQDTHLARADVETAALFAQRANLGSQAPHQDTLWLLGMERVQRARVKNVPTNSRAFAASGYYVMRAGSSADALMLVFDCGAFGYKPLPNHGHADALSFDLFAYGQTRVMDPGYYGTSLGQAWRNYFRGTRAHNTIVVDEQDQSALMDVRRVHRPANATLLEWVSTAEFDFVDGKHDGYERLSEPVTHRRQIFFLKPFYWIVIDWLTGAGNHTFDLLFHLTPDATVQLNPRTKMLTSIHADGSALDIVPLDASALNAQIITGQVEPIQGWVSPNAGIKCPAPVLRYRRQTNAPAVFCTGLFPRRAGDNTTPALKLLTTDLAHSTQLAAQIETDKFSDYLMVDCATTTARKQLMQYETDARLFFARHRQGDTRPVQVLQHGGAQKLSQVKSKTDSLL